MRLQKGVCRKPLASDAEFWGALMHLFVKSPKSSTYKYALLKCLVDCSRNLNGVSLSFDTIYLRFTEIYWDLIVKYRLDQLICGEKGSLTAIEKILYDYMLEYDLDETSELSDLPDKARCIMHQEVRKRCSVYVIDAFYTSTQGLFYSFSKPEKILELSHASKVFLQRYDDVVQSLNYWYWAKEIERINGAATPGKLLTSMLSLGKGTH